MWQKATCYKSATFAALVVASSLALLTGAQSETLNFGSGTFTFAGNVAQPEAGTFTIGSNNPTPVFFNGTNVGTANFQGPGGGNTFVSIGGFNPATSTFEDIGPNTSTLTGPVQNTLMGPVTMPMFGSSGDLQGDITITSIQDNTTGLRL